MAIRSFLTALGLNAVPAAGWFVGEWSAGTMLVLYWLETLIGTFLVALRIVLHRRRVPAQGHFNYEAPKGAENQAGSYRGATYLTAFLMPALVFTIAHGFFLGVLGLVVFSKQQTPEGALNPEHLVAGLIGIAIFQLIDFISDLIWLRTRPFAWIERLGQASLSRVIVIHLTIIGGMAAVMFTGANRNFFGVFIFLKTMLNLSLVLPQWKPKTPPAWLSNAMDRIKPSKEDGTFAEFWVKTDEQEASRIVRNESSLRRK
ncbi:MAG TPA: DUF6498-containing protein [Chthoniobacterales bacterium]|nr:DUF6498-containing protein [Chthoniobacterales bacterium]